MKPRIAVIGSVNMDLVAYLDRAPGAGETVEGRSFETGFGGKGANQAVAAARLGSDVLMVAKVGSDDFGVAHLRNFADNGIDARFVSQVDGVASGVAPILVEANGENRIVVVPGANALVSPADVDRAAEALRACRLILLQLEIPLETVRHALAFARRHGIETVLNPAPAGASLEISDIRDATFVVPNETELARLSGRTVSDAASAELAARVLVEAGVRCVIVTMGGRGALLVSAEEARPIRPIAVEPIDTTGAGDAFIGAFAHFHAILGEAEPALRLAARYAAMSTLARGAQKSYPTEAEFAAF